jgi:ankyrin repeat protein
VLAALEALPERERTLVEAYYLSDRKLADVAAFHGVPEGTAKRRLHTARGRLASTLEIALEKAFTARRPSRDEAFEARVMDLALATYLGDVERAADMLRSRPELARGTFRWFWYWHWRGEGWTPLHRAAEQGLPEVVSLLLEHGADPTAAHAATGWTPLHMALAHGVGERHRRVAGRLIAAGARVDAWAAASLGDLSRLAACHEPGRRGPDGALALHFASTAEAVRFLIERGERVDARDAEHGNTPLRWNLASRSVPEVTRALLEAGAVPDVFDASAAGDLPTLRSLLRDEPGAARRTVARRDLHGPGFTPLHVASAHGHAAAVRVLLEHGADPNALAPSGNTPLQLACFNLRSEAVRELLAAGAATGAPSADDGTPALHWVVLGSSMWWAPRERLEDVVRALLAAGACPDERDAHGCTALEVAAMRGDSASAARLATLIEEAS